MKIIIRIYKRIASRLLVHFIYPLKNLIYEVLHKDYVVLTASVVPLYHNWGDDANIHLARLIAPHKHFIVNGYTWNIRGRENVLCIGSIITWMTTPKSLIWGSGIVYPQKEIVARPKKVLAVRGPLTRRYLNERGIVCPEIYGDPALLFPRFYKPTMQKKYKLGLIPHFRDKDNKIVKKFLHYPDVRIIDVQNIRPWHQFIDDICTCECVATSSLHGLIISDAYEVPNLWVAFPDGERKDFAFHDYLQSVERDMDEPFQITNKTTIADMISATTHHPIPINLDVLLEACPFSEMKTVVMGGG